MPRTISLPPHSSQRGITLLESMIALLITALGILGIVGVQMRTLVDTQNSVRRAQAVRLIEDLSERLRANPSAQMQVDDYISDFGDVPDEIDHSICADANNSGCSPQALAQYDLAIWKESVRSNLPGGQAKIIKISGGGQPYPQLGVVIAWRNNSQRHDADASYRQPFTLGTGDPNHPDDLISCLDEHLCHLQYLAVPTRCALPDEHSAALRCS